MKKSTQLYLITLSVVIAIIAVYTDNKMLHYIFKPVSTLLIILIPILFAKSNLGRYKNSILIGLVCCLVGDILLMFDSYFIFGLVSFLIGHAFFIYSFSIINGFAFKIKTLIPLLIIAGFVFINLKDHLGELLIPVLLYITCIVLMAWQAINLYVWKKGIWVFTNFDWSLFVFSIRFYFGLRKIYP
ncbi:lysoplasmalogenase [Cellulophaga tyrosinoxydans]|uniref:Uncharacterized membrane protein YhhN n=1 Tax=Cellulophaga tyrosinoxydans TaxID=504486 RepID=A0A1W1Z0Z8_9FLAO|nr:lysoplasmalogenase [Cellulophaga tyrosinoxydans]SMC42135.1 Uncharacterized membrane protein YhhN [Cellulophaga tyrosinoxydans]